MHLGGQYISPIPENRTISYGPETAKARIGRVLACGTSQLDVLMERTIRRAGPRQHVRMSTRAGDVLILLTAKSYTVFAVGQVSKDGQCDFDGEPNVQYTRRRDEALTVANALLVPGRRILVQDLDTGKWSDVSS